MEDDSYWYKLKSYVNCYMHITVEHLNSFLFKQDVGYPASSTVEWFLSTLMTKGYIERERIGEYRRIKHIRFDLSTDELRKMPNVLDRKSIWKQVISFVNSKSTIYMDDFDTAFKGKDKKTIKAYLNLLMKGGYLFVNENKEYMVIKTIEDYLLITDLK